MGVQTPDRPMPMRNFRRKVTTEMPVWVLDSGGPKEACIRSNDINYPKVGRFFGPEDGKPDTNGSDGISMIHL